VVHTPAVDEFLLFFETVMFFFEVVDFLFKGFFFEKLPEFYAIFLLDRELRFVHPRHVFVFVAAERQNSSRF
jgi:hypothetical protein